MRVWDSKLKHHVEMPDEAVLQALRLIFHYDPVTGFWWRRPEMLRADHKEKDGYRVLRFCGKKFKSQNLAYFYVTCKWPESLIDHHDLNRGNNAWLNLRPANRQQNSANSKLRKDNKSGLKGVYFNKENRLWTAQINVGGKTKNLANLNCPAAAHFAYLVAADMAFGEFARAR
jgi:hypothetical protein